jgi:hypothetical protein
VQLVKIYLRYTLDISPEGDQIADKSFLLEDVYCLLHSLSASYTGGQTNGD